eukprot:GFUD01039241.1.p2 GENE.GFUD01039241.1~~GFUD01039241.1.p2  ORF type:complete len:409 (-),score=98.72 GFUD01039241.1:53-1279(-)
MTAYFNTAEINTALTNISSKLTDRANVANLYPILKKATSSSEQPTPGYAYQVLIEFSYESRDNCKHLVQYLNKRLQRPSAHGVLKTLKTIKQLTEKGSREFRRGLRENDEYIKSAPNYGSQHNSFTGTDILSQIRTLSKELLVDLFSEETLIRDSSAEPEVVPVFSQNLAGMGNSTAKSGKYEGFGNSPINKNSVTDKMRDVLESVINLPDPKQQILDLCLEDSTGDYEAIHLPEVSSYKVKQSVNYKPKAHVPGKAGGGWEDSSDEDESTLGEFESMQISEENLEESENSLTKSAEYEIVEEFCTNNDKANIWSRIEGAVTKLTECETLNGVFCIMNVLDSDGENNQFRALLLLEHLIHKGVVSPSKVHTVYLKVYKKLENSDTEGVSIKAKKINLILNALKATKNI